MRIFIDTGINREFLELEWTGYAGGKFYIFDRK
jgi:hypothetical protein